MPQSLTRIYAHLIFSTKNRQPLLDDGIQARVHAYLATAIRDLDSPWVVVGGVADHVHILFDIGKMTAPVKFVEHVKRESSKFIKTLGTQYRKFYWQRGYGMFSVSPKDRDEAEHYVRNQEKHHRRRSFQDEYRAILTCYGLNSTSSTSGTSRLQRVNMAFGQRALNAFGSWGVAPGYGEQGLRPWSATPSPSNDIPLLRKSSLDEPGFLWRVAQNPLRSDTPTNPCRCLSKHTRQYTVI